MPLIHTCNVHPDVSYDNLEEIVEHVKGHAHPDVTRQLWSTTMVTQMVAQGNAEILILWCSDCRHRTEHDANYVCGECGGVTWVGR